MKNFFIISLTLSIVIFVFSECSSVKTRTVKITKPLSEQTKLEMSESSSENNQKAMKEKYHNRYDDTVVINITNVQITKSESTDSYNQGLQLFDDGNYSEANKIFEELLKSINKPNQKYYEIQFYLAECQIQFADYSKAEQILKLLTESSSTNKLVLEKSIVRLGQLYCILDKKDLATSYFQRLKREFPKSEYLHFADCSMIK